MDSPKSAYYKHFLLSKPTTLFLKGETAVLYSDQTFDKAIFLKSPYYAIVDGLRGQMAYADSFDESRKTCGHGIHFFLSFQEAVEHSQ